jgi:hypothetical protein
MAKEYADLSAAPRSVFDELEQAQRASRIFGVDCVQRRPDGRWRPAAAWRGSRQATENADREIRLHHAEREMRATDPGANRRRRLRLAELSIDPATRRRLQLAMAERSGR